MSTPFACLASVVPTPEEVREAQNVIAMAADPEKAAKSKMQSMKHWLKAGGHANNPVALESRGDLRKRYLTEFMVLQAREKSADLPDYHEDSWYEVPQSSDQGLVQLRENDNVCRQGQARHVDR